MRNLKNLSPEANQLRSQFQVQVVIPYINKHNGLNGYKGQIYILLPKFDGRLRLYKGVSRDTYSELYNYLFGHQSQRRFSQTNYSNQLMIVKSFLDYDLTICYNRVWHNGTTVYTGEHWKAQALALRNGIDKYGFTYYDRDYNFGTHLHRKIDTANPFLVKLYEKIIAKKLSNG